MRLISENLVIVTRKTPITTEILTGTKNRGIFKDRKVFPGGKAERATPPREEAARELYEEAGIEIPVDTLRHLGNLLIHDMRPEKERFGNVFLFGVEVGATAKVRGTEEFKEPEWQSIHDPHLTDNIPPDVPYWLHTALSIDAAPIVTHLTYDQAGELSIVVKKPHFAHTAGEILEEATLSPQEYLYR
jgi:8-oxo-dGTP pyrophosphatase MutT (NUDIX family)